MIRSLDELNHKQFDAIVIGSGFGGAVAITKLAAKGKKILVLERGTWWGNPEGPGLKAKKTKTLPVLLGMKKDERQWWPRPNDSQGLVYMLKSVYKEVDYLWDKVNFFIKDNDLGFSKNRKGLYRLTRFKHEFGNVDIISGNGVGGGSLFYSGVNLIPVKPVLKRIGLDYLTSKDFQNAGEWMNDKRARINKINTKVPVPNRVSKPEDPAVKYQLVTIPESGDPIPNEPPKYEMPDPKLEKHEEDYLYLDRARVLKRALDRVINDGGFSFTDNNVSYNAEVVDEDNGNHFKPIPLSVVEYDPNIGGNSEKKNAFCLREGRCINGCLPSARHTLYKTILKETAKEDETNADISVVPQSKVSHIDQEDGVYTVHFDCFLNDEEGERKSISAKKVFLAAGCLGTSEILIRSKEKNEESHGQYGLPLGQMVGKKFSTNGDFFGFSQNVHDLDQNADDDKRIGRVNPTYGPINSSHFYIIFDKDTDKRIDINVEDAGIPTMFARLTHDLIPAFGDWQELLKLGKKLVRALFNRDPFDESEKPDTTAKTQTSYQTERELVSDLFFYNLMATGPNEPFGTFELDKDGSGLKLKYEKDNQLKDWQVYKNIEKVLDKLSKKMNAKYVKSPFWERENRVAVTHPLGGCPIGKDRNEGAIDEHGRVFDGSPQKNNKDVLPGLYVIDASAIPGALAVNPTLTIVAQAIKSVDKALVE